MATNFFDIQPPRVLWDEYIEQVADADVRRRLVGFHSGALSCVTLMKTHGWKTEFPIVRIDPSLTQNAQAMNGVIYIDEGLIRLCLALEAPPVNEVVEIGNGEPEFLQDLVPKAGFIWMFLHELNHGVRRHAALSESILQEPLTIQATEYDADLCAVAGLYRWYQLELAEIYSDAIIRQLTLFCIFWAIRELPEPASNDTHLSTAIRLWAMICKVANLQENSKGLADPDGLFSGPNIEPCAVCIAKCEKIYQERNPNASGNIITAILDIIQNHRLSPIIERWDQIRLHIGHVSGIPQNFILTSEGKMKWQELAKNNLEDFDFHQSYSWKWGQRKLIVNGEGETDGK